MNNESEILSIMHRLGLKKIENGLLTYAVLEELWDKAFDIGYKQAEVEIEKEED
jgi:hypothetical protein